MVVNKICLVTLILLRWLYYGMNEMAMYIMAGMFAVDLVAVV